MELEGKIRIPSGCAIAAVISREGNPIPGNLISEAMRPMHDRSNGLGGGFAGYGIYPAYKDFYALHIFFDSRSTRKDCEAFIKEHFEIVKAEIIPTEKNRAITDEPIIWRYFVSPLKSTLADLQLDEKEFVVRTVVKINSEMKGAYVFSSGKNMGTFKAVGYPEDVGEYYRLGEYRGYSWTAHGRYPTNTPGWWGGAHPFGLLDLSVVHNGEISSYDANRRAMETYGYKCTLLTDTEVITYIVDYLTRVKGLSYEEAASVMAAPFWQTIDRKSEEEKERLTYLRHIFASELVTGPFSIIVGFENGVMALNDRLKLRSLVVGEKGDKVYMASEESAIRLVQPDLDKMYYPKGGEPVVYRTEVVK